MTRARDKLDLLLPGGRVIDPANTIDAPMAVGIRGGRIARVEAGTQGMDVPRLWRAL